MINHSQSLMRHQSMYNANEEWDRQNNKYTACSLKKIELKRSAIYEISMLDGSTVYCKQTYLKHHLFETNETCNRE